MDPASFVRDYTSDQGTRLRFAWNGKHGDEFEDGNVAFRRGVLEAVLANPGAASVDLLRCLWEAETQCAKEAWGVQRDLHLLGQALLDRGGPEVVLDFLHGQLASFDTYCAGGRVRLSPELADSCAAACRGALETAEDESERKVAEFGVEKFEAMAAQGREDARLE